MLPPEVEDAAKVSWVHVAAGDSVLGALAFEEALRPEAPAAIAALRELGCTVEVLTGDSLARGRRLEARLGIPVHSALLPADKVEHLTRARRGGEATVMVGDGHNDAPVIAAADVGMALGSGTEIARDTADVVLLDLQGAPLGGVPYVVGLARRTVRRIRLNLFWAFGYNTCGMALGAAGLVHPVLAAGLMIASSLFVVAISTAAEPELPRARLEGSAAPAVEAPSELAPC
jgi:P-type E1-E2 ATPase